MKSGFLLSLLTFSIKGLLFGQNVIPAFPAQFPGGEKAMVQWISTKLKYPKEALDASVEGTLNVWLMIDTSGKVHMKGFVGDTLGHGCESIVRQMVSEMPPWNPSFADGKKLVYENILPLRFSLPKEKNTLNRAPVESLQMPQFKEGEQGLIEYLKTCMEKYRMERNGAKGELHIEFFVEEDGRIIDVWIANSTNPLLDGIGLKMAREMPNWIPGSLNGKTVRVLSSLLIRFD